jgi:pimeloyl-ACP methyl ester carboxylesterase
MVYRITLTLVLCTMIAAYSKAPNQELKQEAPEPMAMATRPIMIGTPDGVEIAATVHSTGLPTVVLVHGWMCDQTYWEAQVPALSGHFGVVTVDLAGHGLSGTNRQNWTISTLGDDIAAVISQLQLQDVVVIGHSMGGRVGLEVARLLPGTVVGVIGVDTLHDADSEWDPKQVDGFLAGFETDFTATCNGFVRSMFGDQAAVDVIEGITTNMCGGPAEIGTALFRDYAAYDLAAALGAARVPVRSINADKWPTNVTANQQYAEYEATILSGYGHFLMQEAPGQLNKALLKAVTNLGVED